MASESIWKAIAVTAQIYGRQFTKEAALLYASDLEDYPEAAVLNALSRCRKELRNFPTVADIILRIDDGRPGAEEAWAMIPTTEDASVVWTEEIRDAYGISRGLMSSDMIAARMAFRETYLRLVSDARAQKKPVRWEPSLGLDPIGREIALKQAVEKGRLKHDHAQSLLPSPIRSQSKLKQIGNLTPDENLTQVNPKEMLARIRSQIENP